MSKSSDNEYVVGLDIGTTKIAVVVGRENEQGKIEVVGYGKTESLGVRRGFVSNLELTVQSIIKAIKEAEDSSNVEITNVIVGIAGQYIQSMQQRGFRNVIDNEEWEIRKADIDNLSQEMYKLAVKPGEQIIDVIPQEYTVDGEPGIVNPIGMIGRTIETNFHIITAQITAVNNIMKSVERAGLKVDAMVLEPIASARAVLSEEETEAGVAIVDIGGGTSDVAIIQDNILRYTAVIPFGGDIITEDIREGCTIIKKYAEDLKVKFGSAVSLETNETEIVAIPGLKGRPPKEISLKNLASIIQARMEEIFELVTAEIGNSGYESKLIGGIVLTGGGSLLKNIIQLAAFITGKDVKIGYPNEYLDANVDKELSNPIYSTAIGLVKIGVEKAKHDSQPEEEDKEQIDNDKRKKKSEDKTSRRNLFDIIEDFIKPM